MAAEEAEVIFKAVVEAAIITVVVETIIFIRTMKCIITSSLAEVSRDSQEMANHNNRMIIITLDRQEMVAL